MDRYYESREGFQPKQALSPRTLETTMAERDKEMLRTGLIRAQENKSRVQPKVDSHNPLYQKHFLENLRLADRVRHGYVTIDQ